MLPNANLLINNIHRQMSEELLLNDRRGNLIQGLQPRSILPHGCEKPSPAGIRTTDLANRDTKHFQLRNHNLILDVLRPIYISNKLYFGERAIEITQKWRMQAKKVTWEVKECSRRNAQNCQAKNLHKKYTFTIIVMNFVQEQLKKRKWVLIRSKILNFQINTTQNQYQSYHKR